VSARLELVELLRAGLPGKTDPEPWDVLEFERELGDIRRPTVMVGTQRIEKGPSSGVWLATMRALVVAPHEKFEAAEALLETGVLTVLRVLEEVPHVSLTAERVTLEPKHHAYRVDLQITLPKEDKP
jgi:hypothetical protein